MIMTSSSVLVRISPATAKFKPVPGMPGVEFAQMPFSSQMPDQQSMLPLPLPTGTKSVSTPLASNNALNAANSLNSMAGSSSSMSAPSLSAGTSLTSTSSLATTPSDEILKGIQMSNGNGNSACAPSNVPSSISAGLAQQTQDQLMAQKYNIPEESWKHHAQARAILSNLIGPNGEQLTSSDPYNTTVFVGGLSPLISEETLRTFFAPFGEIHYVR